MKLLDHSRVRIAVLHHSAHEPRKTSNAIAEASRIRGWHMQRGFEDIGYHFVIKGNSYTEGRDIRYQGAHCLHWNQFSLGFCVAGDLTKRAPTRYEVDCVVSAICDAEYQLGHKLVVFGHNQLGSTLCPGPDLVRLVNTRLYKQATNSAA